MDFDKFLDLLAAETTLTVEQLRPFIDEESGEVDVEAIRRADPNVTGIPESLIFTIGDAAARIRREEGVPDDDLQAQRDRESELGPTVRALEEQAAQQLEGGDVAGNLSTIDQLTGLAGAATGLSPQIQQMLSVHGVTFDLNGSVESKLGEIMQSTFGYDAMSNVEVVAALNAGGFSQAAAIIDETFGPPTDDSIVLNSGTADQIVFSGTQSQALQQLAPNATKNLPALLRVAKASDVPIGVLALAAAQEGLFDPEKRSRTGYVPGLNPQKKGKGGLAVTDRKPGLGQRLGDAIESATQAALGEVPEVKFASMFELGTRLRQEFVRYDRNYALALVALQDPKLANKLTEDNPDLTLEESELLADVLKDVDPNLLQGSGFEMGPLGRTRLDYLKTLMPGGEDGLGGSVSDTVLPSEASMNESVRNLYRGWFQREPGPEELERFRSRVDGLYRAHATASESVPNPNAPASRRAQSRSGRELRAPNPLSELSEFARSTPEYQALFGNKDPGQTEEQYVQGFQRAASPLLGGQQASSSAVRAGQATGDLQTTVGQTFTEELSAGNNSTFMGRLASIAEQIERFT